MTRPGKPTWQPGSVDYQQVFDEQNPWHSDGRVPDAWGHQIERPLARHLWSRLRHDEPRRFQLIFGPRRVGKTTAMYQTVRHLLGNGVRQRQLWWLRLDHPLLMSIPLNELVVSALRETHERPLFLFLDEITYADKWDLWLKTFYDETWPVRVLGSSSSTAALRDRRLESGVGRWEEQYLAPYLFEEFLDLSGHGVGIPAGDTLADTLDACFRERVDASGLVDLRRRFLLTGGFPELLLAAAPPGGPVDEASLLLQSQRTLRSDAVERAVYKDIPQAFDLDSPLMLERLLYTLAGQFTGLLSPSSLCGDLGISQPTFDKYLSYLERAFLVFTLLNYSGNETTKQKRGRKLYFVDGAVRNAALQRGVAPLRDNVEMGLLIENLLAGHLHALSQQSQVRLYYWRHKAEEIDLVYDQPDKPLAFEVASSAGHHRGGMRAFLGRFPRFRGRCYLVAPNAPPVHAGGQPDGIGTVPLDLLLLAVAAQAGRELGRRLAA